MSILKLYPVNIATGHGVATDVTFTARRPNDPMIVPMNNFGAATENGVTQ